MVEIAYVLFATHFSLIKTFTPMFWVVFLHIFTQYEVKYKIHMYITSFGK